MLEGVHGHVNMAPILPFIISPTLLGRLVDVHTFYMSVTELRRWCRDVEQAPVHPVHPKAVEQV